MMDNWVLLLPWAVAAPETSILRAAVAHTTQLQQLPGRFDSVSAASEASHSQLRSWYTRHNPKCCVGGSCSLPARTKQLPKRCRLKGILDEDARYSDSRACALNHPDCMTKKDSQEAGFSSHEVALVSTTISDSGVVLRAQLCGLQCRSFAP